MLSGNFLESLSDMLRAVASSLFHHRVHRPDQEQHPHLTDRGTRLTMGVGQHLPWGFDR